MCHFSTPVFTKLLKHRVKHKDCLLICEICDDNVQQTLPQLTKHCQTHHTLNGQYHCHKCNFSIEEIKQFVCHSCPLNTVPIKDIREESINNSKFKNSLLNDASGVTQKDELLKHMAAACRQRWSRRNWWRKREPASKPDNNLSQDFKFLLPKQEPHWTSPVFSAPGLLDDHRVLLDPEKTLEETQQFLERTVSGVQKWPKSLKSEQNQTTPSPAQSKSKRCSTPHPGLRHAGKDKLTGLMEKNNISVPPDCTTKVVGLKMVDGKKHLVLKVIPTTKREVLSPRESNDAESQSQTEKPSDQTLAAQDGSNNVSTSNDSGNLTSRRFSYQAEKLGHGVDQRDFLTSIVKRRRSQQGDGHHDQEHSDRNTPMNVSGDEDNLNPSSHQCAKELPSCSDISSGFNSDSERHKETKNMSKEEGPFTETDIQSSNAKKVSKDCRTKAVSESEENCSSDLALCLSTDGNYLEECQSSQPVTLESKNESTTTLSSNLSDQGVEKVASEIQQPPNPDTFLESCSISEFDCVCPVAESPLKDLTETLCGFQSEDGDVLFHSSGDECKNNMDPRDPLLPVGQYNCEMRERQCTSDLYQMVDELPITTISHLLDGVRAHQTLRLDNSTDSLTSEEKGSICTEATNQQSEPVNTDVTSNTVPSSTESSESSIKDSSIPITSQNEPALNRKRMGEISLNDSSGPDSKFQKRSTVSLRHWEPEPRDIPRTLRLIPQCSTQSVKIPLDNQPVIVLNHPDSDIPEVTNIMRVVHKHSGAVERVVLSRKTINALSELNCDDFRNNTMADCHASHCRREWPNGTVKEKFSLKLKFKRVCGRKYTVVPTVSENAVQQPTFRCWFCGRIFRNQEAWVGHGQRHLMEATRGWNKLFNR
ncbi:zinc finger protein 518A [Xyrauchen texanus]|uniref:zinc finger protein 518A n=1 Tax=Xyrauchen texanus TaxID=154827 RepID=UPI002241CA75|nr:zinc finger protein 518A [Xyrauchen texanus]